MKLEDAENEIKSIYEFFHREVGPAVVVQEEGHLAQLWAVVDSYLDPETGEERG